MTRKKEAFTLVELLVVIGIIAVLIAILMPALSRARKQALAVSCGSNERQVVYAALAYANDWKQSLPTRTGYINPTGTYGASGNTFWPHPWLCTIARLPVIGWDTVTIWDWRTYDFDQQAGDESMLGGWAFMLRDYLKNDVDIMTCPDGWYETPGWYQRWDGYYDVRGPWHTGGNGAAFDDERGGLMSYHGGYLWLPHRIVRRGSTPGAWCGGTQPTTDRIEDVSTKASGKPDLLVMADFNIFSTRGHYKCASGGPTSWSQCGVAANHATSTGLNLPSAFNNCAPIVGVPNIGEAENPDQMPLGMNTSRIDARTTWVAWQDWDYYKSPENYGGLWHSF